MNVFKRVFAIVIRYFLFFCFMCFIAYFRLEVK